LPLAILAVATLLVIAALCAPPLLAARRRRALRNKPFPAAWESILRERVPQAALLPRDLAARPPYVHDLVHAIRGSCPAA